MSQKNEPAAWIDDVLDFWFTRLTPEEWFATSPAVDADIGRRFGDLHAGFAKQLPEAATGSARGVLAAVIVLDQFPRNIFRGSPRSFATDDVALELAETAIRRGLDGELAALERQFLYMPFQHSEDPAVQTRSLEIFAALGDPNILDFARRHWEIIDRFGRFPHRNQILGRESTDDEASFLREPGSSF
jgi:uncharacterized protein (DUF924 family)